MHATVCLLHAGQPRRAGAVSKSGQFIGQLWGVEFVPKDVKGLHAMEMTRSRDGSGDAKSQ